jgi:RHS repeat-associated protein
LPSGIVVIKRNPDGTVRTYRDANGKTTLFSHYPVTPENITAGSAGQLWKITGPDGVSVTYTLYDKNGNPREVRLTDSNGVDRVVTKFDHDALNRLQTLTGIASGLPENVTRFDYDLVGNLTSLVDAESHETKYEYTYDRQLKKISNEVNGLPVETAFEYGGAGCPSCGGGVDKLTAVKDPNHVKNNLTGTVYQYDAAGRLEYETDPIGKKLRYTYYDNGLLREKYDATSIQTLLVTYTYNSRGQLENKLFTDGTYEHYSYYPDGKLNTAANQHISYTYTYHDNGRLKSVTDSRGYKINYTSYDNLGQRKSVTLFPGSPDERLISYDYDAANRPWQVRSNAGTFSYAYDTLGRRDTLAYPNNTGTDWDYDDLNRLTAVRHKHTGGAAFAAFTYPEHDQVGNIKRVTGDRYENYDYDPLYRILNVISANPAAFTWDGAGNRLTGPGAADTNYQYNNANQMTAGKSHAFSYDNAGNRIEGIIPGVMGGTSYTWDFGNQLTMVNSTTETCNTIRTFKYDPYGRRIEKQVNTVGCGQEPTRTTSYVYDNEDIALEVQVDGGGTTKTYYTHGPGIDEPLAMERNGNFSYYHADGLGSIVAITSQSGNTVQRYDYDSFGNIVTISDPSFLQPYSYTGREWDEETGLYFYRARYYDPMVGRFISKDPIGFAGGDVNLYGYVQNNPVNWVDPSGLAGCYVGYPGYPITIPGTNTKVPLTHAGVLSYDSEGHTRYYEYGRYISDFGNVRRRPVPDLQIGPDGKPTPESWAELQDALNKIGNGTKAKTNCNDKADADKINSFSEQRMRDPKRAPYCWNPLNFNACTTFASDALKAGLK